MGTTICRNCGIKRSSKLETPCENCGSRLYFPIGYTYPYSAHRFYFLFVTFSLFIIIFCAFFVSYFYPYLIPASISGYLPWIVPVPTATSTPPPPVPFTYLIIESTNQSNGSHEQRVHLSIDSIGVGQLQIISPTKLYLGESSVVQLSLFPDNSLVNSLILTTPTQNFSGNPEPFHFSDKIDLFPVMRVDLSGVAFEMTSNDQPEKVILSDKPTEWLWTIKPTEEGKQFILVQVSVPVVIDGIEKNLNASLKNIPIEIQVLKTTSRHVDDLLPYLIPSLSGIIGILLGAYINNKVMFRKAEIKALEQLYSQAMSEKKELLIEINRLKSIPKWQFWRR